MGSLCTCPQQVGWSQELIPGLLLGQKGTQSLEPSLCFLGSAETGSWDQELFLRTETDSPAWKADI